MTINSRPLTGPECTRYIGTAKMRLDRRTVDRHSSKFLLLYAATAASKQQNWLNFERLIHILDELFPDNDITYSNKNLSTAYIRLSLSIWCVFRQRSRSVVCANTLIANRYRKFQLTPGGTRGEFWFRKIAHFVAGETLISIRKTEHCREMFRNIRVDFFKFGVIGEVDKCLNIVPTLIW